MTRARQARNWLLLIGSFGVVGAVVALLIALVLDLLNAVVTLVGVAAMGGAR